MILGGTPPRNDGRFAFSGTNPNRLSFKRGIISFYHAASDTSDYEYRCFGCQESARKLEKKSNEGHLRQHEYEYIALGNNSNIIV